MQNPVLQAIKDRRSIRAYTDEQIPDDALQTILDAGLAAPSASNQQPWHFTAVKDKALIQRVEEAFLEEAVKSCPPATRERITAPGYSVFFHAPTVIFLSCPPLENMRYAQTDTGMAVQNMTLAAHALGLGSVILGMPRYAFMGDRAEELRRALCFPEGYDHCLSLAVGYPAMTKEAHPIGENKITILR